MKLQYLSFLIVLLTMKTLGQNKESAHFFNWSQAKQLPDPEGFAGLYAGTSNGVLLIAGGANFPAGKRPWDNAEKKWYDNIYVLERPGGYWREAGKLPRAMGYGVALTDKDGILCIGGGDSKQNYNDAFILKWSHGTTSITYLPPLPAPISNACGVIADGIVYIMGGIESPTGETLNNFWCLDLTAPVHSQKWKVLPDLPGQSRMLATAGACDGKVFLFGGVHLFRSNDGLKREYLKDCWVFTPSKGWNRIDDLPWTLAATPSPAFPQSGKLLLFGGDDGALASQVFTLKDKHPGFRNDILAYSLSSGKWSEYDKIPVDKKTDSTTNPHNSTYAPVTTPLVIWHNKIVIAGGEARPGVRSKMVLIAEPLKETDVDAETRSHNM
jgi:N-acetylneuraminic acid mutarotase